MALCESQRYLRANINMLPERDGASLKFDDEIGLGNIICFKA